MKHRKTKIQKMLVSPELLLFDGCERKIQEEPSFVGLEVAPLVREVGETRNERRWTWLPCLSSSRMAEMTVKVKHHRWWKVVFR